MARRKSSLPGGSAVALLAALALCASACTTWDGVRDGPAARIYFDARMPKAHNARLRVQVHDVGKRCPGSRLNFYSISHRGSVAATDPPYTVELPAGKRTWLNMIYYDNDKTSRLLVGFTLEPGGEYVSLYRNDGIKYGFALSKARTGEQVTVVSQSECTPLP